jgi:hypothetical protein
MNERFLFSQNAYGQEITMTKSKMKLISLPSHLASFAEQAWEECKIEFSCVAAGCGSAEYEFSDPTPALNAIRESVNMILANCVVGDAYEEDDDE